MSLFKFAKSSQTIGKLTIIDDREIKWEIEKFFSYEMKNEYFTSPEFCISGTQWCLKIYPKLDPKRHFKGFVLLYLKGKSFKKPKGVIYNLGVQKDDGSVDIQRDMCWVFDETSTEYGYRYFYDGLQMQNRESELNSSGIFTVVLNFFLLTENFDSLSRWDSTSANFLDLFTSKKDCDVTLKVTSSNFSDWDTLKGKRQAMSEERSKEIVAHKSILADRCPQLAIEHGVKLEDEATNLINIEDCDPEGFEEYLRCLYSGRIEQFSDDLLKVYQVACKFGPNELKRLCKISIMVHMSIENICDVIFANWLHESDLQDKINEFLKTNYDQIILTRKWKWLKNADARLVFHLPQDIGEKERDCC